jgi:hypothetical protein
MNQRLPRIGNRGGEPNHVAPRGIVERQDRNFRGDRRWRFFG